jgi:hypothetical protein
LTTPRIILREVFASDKGTKVPRASFRLSSKGRSIRRLVSI